MQQPTATMGSTGSSGAASNALDPAARRGTATMVVDKLFKALDDDVFPDESVEKIFGISMGSTKAPASGGMSSYPLGQLVYGVWQYMIKGYIEERIIQMSNEDNGGEGPQNLKARVQQLDAQLRQEMVNALMEGQLPGWFEHTVLDLMSSEVLSECMPALGPANNYMRELVRRGFNRVIQYDTVALDRMAGRT